MSDPRLNALFAAFQRDGDPHTLAVVFDGTAPELLRVARYLAADAHAAEDLVQSTFLKAIEHRHRYDAELPVLPWLLGILANTARHERRQQNRVPPAPVVGEAASVVDSAAIAERRERLHQALRGLPEPYRQVLMLQVEHALDSGQIAEITGRKASTVRTQIARGMELLRGALPVGAGVAIASSLSAAAGVDLAGLVGVRDVVLRHAASAVSGPVGAGTLIGGIAVKKLIVALACLLALVSGWWWFAGAEGPTPLAAQRTDAAATAVAPAAAHGEGAAAAATPELHREAVTATAATAVRVTVRFADNSAAPDVGVYLASERLQPFGREGTTNADGVVQFDDVPSGLVTVKPDRGAAQPFTVIAGVNEIDVRLAAGVDVDGRVVDPSGEVVVPHATIFASSREHHDHAQRLAQADANGVFMLRAVQPGTHLFARASGWQPADPKRESVTASTKSPLQLVLRVGAKAASLRGRVVLASGEPAAFAQVAIAVDEDARRHADGLRGRPTGMARQRDVEAFLVRANASGNFDTDEVPEGEALVLARSARGQTPGVALVPVTVVPGADNRCDVTLQPGAQIGGTMRDEAGNPIAGVMLVGEWKGTERVSLEGAFGHLLASVGTSTGADGSYCLTGLLAGEHVLAVHARLGANLRIEQHGENQERVTLLEGEHRRLDLTVPRRSSLAVRLLGPEGKPVAGFGIWVDANPRPTPRMSQLEAQRTDAEGRVRIEGVPLFVPLHVFAFAPRPKEAGDRLVDRLPARQWQDVRVPEGELELRLDATDMPSATLSGRFVDAVGSPVAVSNLELRRAGWDELRRLLDVRAGTFRFEQLPAGRYLLSPRIGGRPLLGLLGPFDLQPGEQRDLGDVHIPEGGSLRVTVAVAGGGSVRNLSGTLVAVATGELTQIKDVRDGVMTTTGRLPGKHVVWVFGDDLAPNSYEVDIASGRQTDLRVECARGFLQDFVVDLRDPVPASPSGWLVRHEVHASDGALLHSGKSPSPQFSSMLAKGTWVVRCSSAGGQEVSTTVTLGDAPSATIVLKPD